MEAGISLHEANTLARIVNVASMRGYMEEDDFKVLNEIMDKLERFAGLLETRTQKKKRIIKKYSRAKGEDRIANFFTTGLGAGLNKKTNFTRFNNQDIELISTDTNLTLIKRGDYWKLKIAIIPINISTGK